MTLQAFYLYFYIVLYIFGWFLWKGSILNWPQCLVIYIVTERITYRYLKIGKCSKKKRIKKCFHSLLQMIWIWFEVDWLFSRFHIFVRRITDRFLLSNVINSCPHISRLNLSRTNISERGKQYSYPYCTYYFKEEMNPCFFINLATLIFFCFLIYYFNKDIMYLLWYLISRLD